MLISIVIPTHNRLTFLLEAVDSIAKQSYSNFEVIVVDDGSEPPITQSVLEEVLGKRIILCRHDLARGVPKAKNAGVNAARGEIILLLDDDDLLMPEALTNIFYAFSNHPKIDCLFLGVRPFGPYADEPAKKRNAALSKIFNKLEPEEHDEIYFFSDDLFDELLKSVPIDFQRPAARRGMWNIVGGFDENSLFSEHTWAILAAAIGTIALTKKPQTEWRIHDNNFGWPSELDLDQIIIRQINNGISSGTNLLKKINEKKRRWDVRAKKIRKHHSEELFSKAYYLHDKHWREGMKALLKSFILSPKLMHLKLAIKYFVYINYYI